MFSKYYCTYSPLEHRQTPLTCLIKSDLLQHFMITFQDDHETLTNLSTINCILTVLLRYFHLTNFFWMFVEGLFGL